MRNRRHIRCFAFRFATRYCFRASYPRVRAFPSGIYEVSDTRPGFVVEKKETRLRRFGFDFEKIYNLVFVSLFSLPIYELISQFYSTNRVWLKKKRDLFLDFGNL